MSRKSDNSAGLVLLIAAIAGFFWSLIKYPIPTISVVNLITILYFPDQFLPVFILSILGMVIYYLAKQSKKPARSNVNQQSSDSYREQQQPAVNNKRPPTDSEISILYKKVIHKYHPDLARSDEDNKFRNELTAKINKARQERDIETLRLFE